ncbi:DciA family protein [Okeania sp.]|uniref:DciA family protein n=1 Tax=Okeania sp. TaxID=3100323 RepID=UPI002B4B6CC4|nr:DciA family protein [Okeania sp.]MEB3343656.1 DciA family protein [Okeania sp.]
MGFQSLNHILSSLKIIERSPAQQDFQKLREYWEEVLGAMASQTQPLYIERGVLYVATSSAALSQELSFRVPQLLPKLNHFLSIPLDNIRFSAAQWHTHFPLSQDNQTEKNDWQQHPSMIPQLTKTSLVDTTPTNQNPQTTFPNWAKAIQKRSQGLPLCPQCQSPTPPGEIQRWSVCAICATKLMDN